MAVVVKRFDVYLINLDPAVGSEIPKTRPCLVISPDEMNHHIRTVIVAPMTSAEKITRLVYLVYLEKNKARSCSIKLEH